MQIKKPQILRFPKAATHYLLRIAIFSTVRIYFAGMQRYMALEKEELQEKYY